MRPHKIRDYVERRDPDFERKMAAVLHVDKEVEISHGKRLRGTLRQPPVVTLSDDEKPGLQALAATSPDRPPVPGRHASHPRDDESKRLGRVSLLAGWDLHTGRVTEIVRDTHHSGDFIAFPEKPDAAYPEKVRIRLIVDHHSSHISQQTQGYLESRPRRFHFVSPPMAGG